jgi:glycosyltransferase involved in cell wall biosynthesis
MRIAYMLNSLGMGGAERHTIALAEWMSRHGHSVLLISLLPRQTEQWPTQLEVAYLDLRKTPTSSLSGLIRARRLLRVFHPDLVHSHAFPANLFARVLRLIGGSPAVLSTMHNVFEGGPARMLAYRLTDFLTLRTTTVSEAVARHALEARAVPPRKRIVFPNAINVSEFTPDAARRSATRAAHAANGDFIWLAAGRIVSAKGFLNLLEAFAQVWVAHPQTQLWIAGEHPTPKSKRAEYTGLVVPKGTTDRIHQLGLSRDVPALLDAADGFVLSSAWEGMPLVVGEAMAMEKSVVATDVGGVRELLGDTGTVVPARDPDALAKAMLDVMARSPELRRVFGRAARGRIATQFDTTILFPKWEAFYESLLGMHRHGA